jgi:beta-glucosidase
MVTYLALPLLAAASAAVLFATTNARADDSRQSQFPAHDAEVAALLAQMTLDEKIGQMMQPDQGSLKDPADIEKYFLGSLLSGGGSGPKDKAKYNFTGWRAMVENYQQHARRTRLAIPLLYGIDAVHGNNNIPGATLFPHNIGMGCTRDSALEEKIARIVAEEVRATAINWTFAPCVTTPQDIRWGRTYEGFSSTPDISADMGVAAVRGFQGNTLDGPLSVVACAKHFIADGGTSWGTAREGFLDQGDTRVDEATLRRIHLPAYKACVNAGVATIMPSYSSWNGLKCSASKYLLTDVLKKELGFEGFLISDYNAVDQISPDYRTAVETAINAGIDMVMMTERYPQFATELRSLINEGRIPQSRIDDAVTRILRVKAAAGLLAKDWSPTADRSLEKSFGSSEHRAVARQAVSESLVLLKNDHKTLPLSKSLKHIQVAGRGADDLGMQCGGWTIDWQGKLNRDIPGATSFLTALRQAAGPACQISHSRDGTGAQAADLGIVVIGEAPYAEMKGDSPQLTLSPEDRNTVLTMKQSGLPVVVILYSGRPLILGDLLDHCDALVAAWLPGSEAAGITDVLFGDHAFTGKLSFNWPASVDDLGHPAKPLFPIGYGLQE